MGERFRLGEQAIIEILRRDAAPYTVLGWQTPHIVSAAKGLQKAGIEFERYQGMAQDELGIWTSPSGAEVAWFKDPDGNR